MAQLKAGTTIGGVDILQQFENISKEFFRREVNVQSLGAVGDGVTDDTNAIQTALNFSKLMGPVKILIPAGTYKVTSVLKIYKNTYLKMEKGTKIMRFHDDDIFINGDTGAIYSNRDAGHGNIIIEGGILDGNILAYPDGYNAIGIAKAKNIIVRDVEIRDVVYGHAIDLNDAANVLIDNCRFLGYKDNTSDQSRNMVEAIQIAEHTSAGFTPFGAWDGAPCENIIVKDCYFGASVTPGTTAWPVGVGHHGAVQDKYNRNIKIVNNTFDSMTYAGVRCFKYQDVIISENTFKDCYRDVVISSVAANTESSKYADGTQSGRPQAGKNIIIDSNIFRGTKFLSIWVAGQVYQSYIEKVKNVHITNNIFDNDTPTSSHLVYLSWVDTVKVIGNSMKKGYRGVFVSFVNNLVIDDNSMLDMTTEAVFLDEPTAEYQNAGHTRDIYIDNNHIENTGRTGIFVQYAKNFRVSDNTVLSPATEEDNTRNGITISSGSSDGLVAHNKVRMAKSGNQNRYGVEVTPTCDNVQLINNDAEGKTGRVAVAGTTNFDGFYITSPNGTRYKATVNNNGQLVINS